MAMEDEIRKKNGYNCLGNGKRRKKESVRKTNDKKLTVFNYSYLGIHWSEKVIYILIYVTHTHKHGE